MSVVAKVVVDVMPKPEILDPQGKAVLGALPRLGFTGVDDVRQGKRFELEIEGELTAERLEPLVSLGAELGADIAFTVAGPTPPRLPTDEAIERTCAAAAESLREALAG